ncbi:conserved hypothetical protein [Humidesulfovibrio mexicanus]|uniref:Lysylphosphatidylglycerol synthase TM region n=1 Tax=Humidesulfovibrio mexicanus TaxID=147047 RepID=A0A239CF68_9BACT|nr:lysylphosphatidylglycerol synthase transmembrane domain-containing protein [Humidesulfovibrio mexicanus]SNS18750.1 conserved hypothetical protein [Humidesulfovibrio mexicanus]
MAKAAQTADVRGLVRRYIPPALLLAGLIAAACAVIDLRRLGELLLAARPWPLVALLACHLANILAHVLRLYVLMDRAVPLRALYHANNVCNMVNSLLPFRAGELAMTLLLSRQVPGGGAEVLSWLFVDRLIGLIAILLVFLAALPGFSPHGAAAVSLANSWVYYVAAFGGIVLLMLVAVLFEEPLMSLARKILDRLPLGTESTLARLRAGIGGLRSLFRLRTSLPVFLLALCCWGFIVALNYFGMLSVIPDPSPTAAIFVTFLTIVGIMLVSTPSGVGTVHGATVLVLSMFGIGAEQALAVGILAHALVTAANIGLGMLSAHSLQFSIGRLLRREQM